MSLHDEDALETVEQEEVEQEGKAELEPDTINEAFNEAINADKDEDNVKLAMVHAGANFKNVTRLYNQFCIDAGLVISKAEKNQILADVLNDVDVSDESGFQSAVAALLSAMAGSTERSAAATVRAYAKKNEIDCFKKPTVVSGRTRSLFVAKFHRWLIDTKEATLEDATAYINGKDGFEPTSDSVKHNASTHIAIYNLVTAIRAE